MTGVYGGPAVAATRERTVGGNGAAAEGHALRLVYDVSRPDAFGGYWTSISSVDLSAYSTVAFSLRCEDATAPLAVGIRDNRGLEGRTKLRPYVVGPRASTAGGTCGFR